MINFFFPVCSNQKVATAQGNSVVPNASSPVTRLNNIKPTGVVVATSNATPGSTAPASQAPTPIGGIVNVTNSSDNTNAYSNISNAQRSTQNNPKQQQQQQQQPDVSNKFGKFFINFFHHPSLFFFCGHIILS
jgi:hypothetical protein